MTNNKRARTTENSRSSNTVAASGGNKNSGSAAAPETPKNTTEQTKIAQTGYLIAKAMKGTKLNSLSDHVASLPKQLAMVIEKQASSMLELVLEIAQRTTAQERFNSQVVNPKTGAKEPFAPSCCRLKNPMSASRLLQDEDAYKAIVVGYDELIEKFKQEARDLLKQSAKLEVSTRKKLLSDDIIKSLKKIAVNISTQEFVRNNCLTEPTRFILNEKEVAYQAAGEYIGGLTTDTIKQWHFANKEAVSESYFDNCLEEGINLEEIEEKALETDYACITLVKTKIADLFPKMTTDLWREHREKDLLRKINAAQAVLNHKQEQNEANEAVAMDLETEQTVNATQLSNILEKMLDDKLKKEKSRQRKNSSADAKSQASKATKHGHGSNNNSNRGRERSNKNSPKDSPRNECSRSWSRGRTTTRPDQPQRHQSRSKDKNKSSPAPALRNGRYNTQRSVRFKSNQTTKERERKNQERRNQGGSSNVGRGRGNRRN